MRNGTNRLSNFELLRLLSMFMIVHYHLLRWFVQDNPAYHWVSALWLPLHVGVVVFVLISGYFHIKASSRGLIVLLGVLFVYSIPEIVSGVKNAESARSVLHALQFVSRSDFWFVKTYLGLYLVSPLLNGFLDHSSVRRQWYILGVFALITLYYGSMARNVFYAEGKNLLFFILVYFIGHMLKEYAARWKDWGSRRLIGGYLLLNVLIVLLYLFFKDSGLGNLVWRLSFPYNSPILILNAVLLFMIFGRMEFKSSWINRLSESCFAVYLIHGSAYLIGSVERPLIHRLFMFSYPRFFLFLVLLLILAIGIMFSCIVIDQCFSPLWKRLDRMGGIIQTKLGF